MFLDANSGGTPLVAGGAWRSFEFAERKPETDRIDDETKNEDKRNHRTFRYLTFQSEYSAI